MEQNYKQEGRLGRLERVASVVVGIAAMITSVKTGKIKGMLGALLAVEMIRRGVTGHCFFIETLDSLANLRAQDRKLDETLEQSFPASDPSATY